MGKELTLTVCGLHGWSSNFGEGFEVSSSPLSRTAGSMKLRTELNSFAARCNESFYGGSYEYAGVRDSW
jgi:hypothetical protein